MDLPKDGQLRKDDLAEDEGVLIVDRIEAVTRHNLRPELLPVNQHGGVILCIGNQYGL